MQGLLDYLKQGQTALTNATGMDWNKIQADPGANAQALMGGQPMQYNQQPQSLIAEQTQPVNNQSNGAFNPTLQQQGQVTYGPQIGPNMGQVNQYSNEPAQLQAGGHSGIEPVNLNFNNRIPQPQVGSLLMGSPEVYKDTSELTQFDDTDYSKQGVISNPPEAQTTPFFDKYGWSEDSNGAHLTGELKEWAAQDGNKFDPSMTDEERLLREQAAARLPWYLGGTGGK